MPRDLQRRQYLAYDELLLRRGRAAEYCDQSVCLFVCLDGLFHNDVTDHLVHVIYAMAIGLLWRRCHTLCTSGFVDDVIFAHNEPRWLRRRKHWFIVVGQVAA